MNYRQQRAHECQKLFADFHIDLTGCRQTDTVLRCLELARNGYFSHEIAEMTGKTPKAIQKIYRRYNFPSLQNFAPPLQHERQGWKGGVKVVKGYSYQRVPGHPNASKHGSYVAVHRLVVEQHLGRYLDPSEVVHHLDDNPQNNSIENLQVFSNNGEHLRHTLIGKQHNISDTGRLRIAAAVAESNRRRAKNQPQPSPMAQEIGAYL
jgi:hypothetical protein